MNVTRRIQLRYFNHFILVAAVSIFLCAEFLPLNKLTIPFNWKSPKNAVSHVTFNVPKDSIFKYIGKKATVLKKELGNPEMVDPTPFGYKWWVYGRKTEKYLQIGVDDKTEKISTIYVLGKQIHTEPFNIGSTVQNKYDGKRIPKTISFSNDGAVLKFELTNKDLSIRPLVQYGSGWMQLDIDRVTNKILAVRYMSSDVLECLKPYTVVYYGHLHQAGTVSGQQWDEIDKAESREIFDISNILRKRYGKKPLTWSEPAATAAYKHSKEMHDKHYFSHDSKWSGNLSQRLKRENINYQMAGENIAAQYPDSAASVLGWMNSIDHRKNLLNGTFNQLGVGVYHAYYTQDFVYPLF